MDKFWKTIDFIGLTHEGGLLGLDLFGLDTTSEDYQNQLEDYKKAALIERDAKITSSIESLKQIFIAMVVIGLLVYVYKTGIIKLG